MEREGRLCFFPAVECCNCCLLSIRLKKKTVDLLYKVLNCVCVFDRGFVVNYGNAIGLGQLGLGFWGEGLSC